MLTESEEKGTGRSSIEVDRGDLETDGVIALGKRVRKGTEFGDGAVTTDSGEVEIRLRVLVLGETKENPVDCKGSFVVFSVDGRQIAEEVGKVVSDPLDGFQTEIRWVASGPVVTLDPF